MREDLVKKLAEARFGLNMALLSGDPTAELRQYVRGLEAELRKLDEAAAALEAAQRTVKEEEVQRINEAVGTLLEARENRLAALASRYAIPARAAHA